jgi:thiamine-monophosphate kinase
MTEDEFIAAMRALATDPAARGLLDDAAVLELGGVKLVLTHDMIVEGVHYLSDDPPADVGWKLLAVNLSDLAAKGATPVGALLGYCLAEDDEWDRAFADGLRAAMEAFALPLLGGDTVGVPAGAPRCLGLTAIGQTSNPVPSRAGAQVGDHLWVSGSIGDAGAGLRVLRGEDQGSDGLVERYRNPRPRLEVGQALAPLVNAMMDVSDGLLIDAGRMAAASGLSAGVDLRLLPLSAQLIEALGDARETRLAAASAGDDYELLFATAPARANEILGLADELGLPLSRIGSMDQGTGLRLFDGDDELPLPDRLGWRHG